MRKSIIVAGVSAALSLLSLPVSTASARPQLSGPWFWYCGGTAPEHARFYFSAVGEVSPYTVPNMFQLKENFRVYLVQTHGAPAGTQTYCAESRTRAEAEQALNNTRARLRDLGASGAPITDTSWIPRL